MGAPDPVVSRGAACGDCTAGGCWAGLHLGSKSRWSTYCFVAAYQCPGLSQLVIFVAGVKFVQRSLERGKGRCLAGRRSAPRDVCEGHLGLQFYLFDIHFFVQFVTQDC